MRKKHIRTIFPSIALGLWAFSLMNPLGSMQPIGSGSARADACYDKLIEVKWVQGAMENYFKKLRSTTWEGIQPFERLKGKRIILSEEFNGLTAAQKRNVLDLLLLKYGEYKSLMPLMSVQNRQHIRASEGSMLPFEVYTHDGRLVSLPYNGCNRITVLTEYERSRLSFLGIKIKRVQRYPMSHWNEEEVKKLFWNAIGYDKAGQYWIAWVPEKGYFEINVPKPSHEGVLKDFWQVAPNYYRYVIVDQGTLQYTYFRGKRSEL